MPGAENPRKSHQNEDEGMPTRYDRCPIVFLSAIALSATVLFWL